MSIPPNMSGKGVRERKFFADEKEAERFAGGLRAQYRRGQRGGVIPYALAIQAAEAAELLEPHGISLIEVVRAAVGRMSETGSSETFSERYARALLENEARWRSRYMSDMEKLPRWVGKGFMAMRLADIDDEAITAALRKHGAAAASTLDMRRRRVSAIVNHRTRHHRVVKVEIMTLAQCRAMLRACESAAERRAVGLLLFAGIRPDAEAGEIARLDWSNVGESEIYVPHEVAKTGSDRHIPISPRLGRLLKGREKDGPCVPANWKRVYQRLRRAAGVGSAQDITRHTFASHFLASYGEKEAKQAMGHTAGSDTIFRHYRRAVTEKAGRKYFGERD